jgi:hypothetical protein
VQHLEAGAHGHSHDDSSKHEHSPVHGDEECTFGMSKGHVPSIQVSAFGFLIPSPAGALTLGTSFVQRSVLDSNVHLLCGRPVLYCVLRN